MKKANSILSVIAVLALFTVGACSNGEQQNVDGNNHEAANFHSMNLQEAPQSYQVGDQAPNNLVCMVNDAFMGKEQIPVPVNGKTYYGCCQMCVETLNEQESARVGIDPHSGSKVDKTEAFIVIMDEEGRVGYFESEANYMAYKKSEIRGK